MDALPPLKHACALVAGALVCSSLHGTMAGAAELAEDASTANYSYEIWYEIRPGAGPSFDAYFEQLRETNARLANSPPRWIDSQAATGRRVVTLPVERLTEYGVERYNETGLPALIGDGPYRALVAAYQDAQVSRASFIRQYRPDLSLNRSRHTRAGVAATEFTHITVVERQERRFESLWKKVLAAYGTTAPSAVMTMARTLAGGGPQYLLTRPLRATPDLLAAPVDAVAAAFGPSEGKRFAREWKRVVAVWQRAVFENAGLDSVPAPGPPAGEAK